MSATNPSASAVTPPLLGEEAVIHATSAAGTSRAGAPRARNYPTCKPSSRTSPNNFWEDESYLALNEALEVILTEKPHAKRGGVERNWVPLIRLINTRPVSSRFKTGIAKKGKTLKTKIDNATEAWILWANAQKQPKQGPDAAPLFQKIQAYRDEVNEAVANQVQAGLDRDAEKEQQSRLQNKLSAAERAVLETENSAATAADAATITVITERGREAAMPGLAQKIRNSAGAKKVADAAKKQADKSQKPSFTDVSGQVNALSEQASVRGDALLKLFASEGRKNRALMQRREEAMARRASSMDMMAQAVADMAKARANHDPDAHEQQLDQDDLAIASKCSAELQRLDKSTQLYTIQETLLNNVALRVQNRKEQREHKAKKQRLAPVDGNATGGGGTGGGGAAVRIKAEGGKRQPPIVVDLLSDGDSDAVVTGNGGGGTGGGGTRGNGGVVWIKEEREEPNVVDLLSDEE